MFIKHFQRLVAIYRYYNFIDPRRYSKKVWGKIKRKQKEEEDCFFKQSRNMIFLISI
jgi:hypothetical protein